MPDTTTVPERPWYPTGTCRQFGSSGVTFRSEEAAEVGRVMDARVHVDVVTDRDREQQLEPIPPDAGSSVDRRHRERRHRLAHGAPRVATKCEEVVERRHSEHRGRRADVGSARERMQIERVVADRDVRTWFAAGARPTPNGRFDSVKSESSGIPAAIVI